MNLLTAFAMAGALMLALFLLLAVVIWAVFFAFNFVPWNGIRRRPDALRVRAAASSRSASDSAPAGRP